ncbi:MAG: molybdopterin dehydrogenase, FAD-binding protein [Variovorax sp.]|nr:molybdopterin dehydrogenase, FAD-binding protein [Variovorax sp.]
MESVTWPVLLAPGAGPSRVGSRSELFVKSKSPLQGHGTLNINTITSIKRPSSSEEIHQWRAGDAWLAGGTWLFSEPQVNLHTLIDLVGLGWPALTPTPQGLDIAATCSIADLYAFRGDASWTAVPLIGACCECLLASFKIWNAATAGGNICMSLPAGAITSLTVALEGRLTLLARNGGSREVSAVDFVVDNNRNILEPGELLRSIHLPASSLKKRFALRRATLTHLGRSAALLVGTQAHRGGEMVLTVTAATRRPVQIRMPEGVSAAALRHALDHAIPADGWFDDVNGTPAYKRHMTYHYAEEIRAELAAQPLQAQSGALA